MPVIRYDVSDSELEARIEAESPGWLAKAAKRTAACKQKKAFDGGAPIWSDVKPVYMRLQHDKCAYCERKLEGEPYGRIEHDVEHFRPKNGVKPWPDDRIKRERGIAYDFPTGEAWGRGYYLLAFHPRNYITACKSCNTPLKANYFPIAGGRRGPQSDNPDHLAPEQPYLLYPLGDVDDDPEHVLTFDGIVPRPSKRSGHRRRRAVVTIDFFELDTREELLRGRAEKIRELMLALIVASSGPQPANKDLAERTIAALESPRSPHSNCVRSFLRLYHQDRPRAQAIFEAAMEYLDSLDAPIAAGPG
jgi:hypothetical protein